MRRLVWIAAVLVALLGIGDAAARWGLGLGDPPLTIRHPTIDYLFKPGCYARFHNTVCYNSHSMRSDEGDTFPLVVMGDSVVNGGALTDQHSLATSILSRELGEPVANVSAGSWGPGNMLAYADAFGWFGAQTIVIVVSSHDLTDLPEFLPDLGPDFPEERPFSALWEAAERYLPRYLSFLPAETASPSIPRPDASMAGPAAFQALVLAARQQAPVCVLFHLETTELDVLPTAANTFRSIAEAAGATFSVLPDDPNLYREGDTIHLNDAGQAMLASAIRDDCL